MRPGRGWLNDLSKNEAARKAFKPGKWNHIRVEAIGDHIRTWLNGVPAADLRDAMTLSGFIGLQVHGIGNKRDGPYEVRWRNLRIVDLGRHEWCPLFNGKDLDGWDDNVKGIWTVKDGIIVGKKPASEKNNVMLFYMKERFKDFTIRAEYRAVTGDSGLYFRSHREEGQPGVAGWQAEIDPVSDAKGDWQTGGFYETKGRGWVLKPDAKTIERALKGREWNELLVSAHGDRVVIRVKRSPDGRAESGGWF